MTMDKNVRRETEDVRRTVEQTELALGELEEVLDAGRPFDTASPAQDDREDAKSVGAHPVRDSGNGLPEGWVITNLEKIADWGSGGTPSRKNAAYYGGSIPWIKTGDLGPRYVTNATEFITDEAVKNSSAKYFPKGSVAIAMYGATIGKTSILGIDATTNQACAVGNPIAGATSTDYLYYFLRNEKDAFIAKGKGGAQPNISQALIKAHELSLPPLAEQTVIAQTLDTLLAQVDNIKTRLDAIPNTLKTFRQSVLSAAVSGKLTEAWRGENECGEWTDVTLEQVTKVLDPHPSHRTPPVVEGGVPYIGIGDLKPDGTIDFENARKVSPDILKEHNDRYQLKGGDFVFGKIGTLGRATKLPVDREYTLSANVILIQPNLELTDPAYVMFFLSCPATMEEVARQSNSTSQAAFGIKKMRAFKCKFPPLEEQTEIVRRVEELFAFADQIEQQVINAQGRVNNLTQSILAKAFRGELTAQWRADNPDLISGENSAEALLAKIQQERDALKKSNKPKKATKKKTTAKKTARKKASA